MSVSFNDTTIQNPQLGNAYAVAKSQQILQVPGGRRYSYDLDATLVKLGLPFRNLRNDEKDALETFFETTVEGVYQDFLYTDHRGLPWLAHFTQDELDFRCVDDESASAGTFTSDGDSYPTTTREDAVWDVDVELEAIELPLLWDGTMEDASHKWDGTTTLNGGTVDYNADSARSGSLGFECCVPAGGADKRAYGRLTSISALSVWMFEFWIKGSSDFAMGDTEQFWVYYDDGNNRINLRCMVGGSKTLQVVPGAGDASSNYDLDPITTWSRVRFLCKNETRTGAKDGLHLLFIDDELVWSATQVTGNASGYACSWIHVGFRIYVDTNTVNELYFDDCKCYGV